MRGILPFAVALTTVLGATPCLSESFTTTYNYDECQVVLVDGVDQGDRECSGYEEFPIFLNEGDARTDVDFGLNNNVFETFSAFNYPGDSVEWMRDEHNEPHAAIIRFFIRADSRSAEALVVSKVGRPQDTSDGADEPGCVVGIVDAGIAGAEGIARGFAEMSRLFECKTDRVIIYPGGRGIASSFHGANDSQ